MYMYVILRLLPYDVTHCDFDGFRVNNYSGLNQSNDLTINVKLLEEHNVFVFFMSSLSSRNIHKTLSNHKPILQNQIEN